MMNVDMNALIVNQHDLPVINRITPFGSGLIHKTRHVQSNNATYILQQVNHNVYKQPFLIEDNICLIEEFLKKTNQGYLLQAVRFLTDYLNGDVYCETQYDNHNHVQAMNQFVLLAVGKIILMHPNSKSIGAYIVLETESRLTSTPSCVDPDFQRRCARCFVQVICCEDFDSPGRKNRKCRNQ